MPNVEQDSTNEVEVTETVEETVDTKLEEQPKEESPQENPSAVADLPDWAQTLIKDLREENASRRISNRNQSEVLEQILGVVKELSPEPDATAESNETPVEPVDTSKKNIAEELAKVVGRMNRDNNVLRVSLETGFPVDVVESFRGETYDELKEAATKLSAIVPDKKKTEPKKNSPAKAPSGSQQQSGRSNAERSAIYFGSARSAGGIFGGGGIKTFKDD